MNCPSCRKPLAPLRTVSAVRAWRCEGCGGIAAEVGSLGESVPSNRVEALEKALHDAPPGARPCPRCHLFMRCGRVRGGFGMVDVDGCVECRIAWFDHGEIKNLRTTFGEDGSPLPSSMTPEERHAWRMKHLREDAELEEQRTDAAILGMVLGIPLPDPVRGRKRPAYTTWAIALATALASIAGFVHGVQASATQFGLIPDLLRAGRAGGLLSHFFVHADPFHLLGNLAYFVVFGTRVEALVGPARFAAILVLATIGGGLLHAAGAPNPSIPLIGASGGISGILAAYVFLRPRATIRMVFWYRVVRIQAVWFFAFWIFMQLLGTAAQMTHASAVSALGHIGGAAVGVALGFAWRAQAEKVEGAIPARP